MIIPSGRVASRHTRALSDGRRSPKVSSPGLASDVVPTFERRCIPPRALGVYQTSETVHWGASVVDTEADHPLFEKALDAVDAGDVCRLRSLLKQTSDLVRAASTSVEAPYDGYFHGATLLHHVAGNPIRGELPDNVVEVARVLLEAGADPDTGCGGGPEQPESGGGTVLGLVTSGAQAHIQGHTESLIDVLLEHGATLDPDGGMWGTLYHTVEHQGQRDVAHMLHARGVRADLPISAGLGRLDLVQSFIGPSGTLLPDADEIWRRTVRGGAFAAEEEVLVDALLAASVNGWPNVVSWPIDRGAAVDGQRPWGPFPITPLHGSAWAGWPEVVGVLLDRGADPTILEPTHKGTPREWAEHAGRSEAVAAFEKAGL